MNPRTPVRGQLISSESDSAALAPLPVGSIAPEGIAEFSVAWMISRGRRRRCRFSGAIPLRLERLYVDGGVDRGGAVVGVVVVVVDGAGLGFAGTVDVVGACDVVEVGMAATGGPPEVADER